MSVWRSRLERIGFLIMQSWSETALCSRLVSLVFFVGPDRSFELGVSIEGGYGLHAFRIISLPTRLKEAGSSGGHTLHLPSAALHVLGVCAPSQTVIPVRYTETCMFRLGPSATQL